MTTTPPSEKDLPPTHPPPDPTAHHSTSCVRTLTDTEWLSLCHSLGAIARGSDALAPASHLPDGLYKAILRARRRAQLRYYLTTTLYSTCVVLQVVLGAVLTALGTQAALGVVITVLAAANTATAGLVALLHNSGLPGRFRSDWHEFRKVEMHVLQLVRSGVVRRELLVGEVVERCWAMFREAEEAVAGNKPASYIGTPPVQVAVENGVKGRKQEAG